MCIRDRRGAARGVPDPRDADTAARAIGRVAAEVARRCVRRRPTPRDAPAKLPTSGDRLRRRTFLSSAIERRTFSRSSRKKLGAAACTSHYPRASEARGRHTQRHCCNCEHHGFVSHHIYAAQRQPPGWHTTCRWRRTHAQRAPLLLSRVARGRQPRGTCRLAPGRLGPWLDAPRCDAVTRCCAWPAGAHALGDGQHGLVARCAIPQPFVQFF